MSVRNLVLPLLLALSALCVPAAAETHRFVVDIGRAPPPARVEVVPAPRRGWVWAEGHWAWRHNHHVWVRGHWIHARHGYQWANPRWVEHEGHWRFERGRWER